MSKNKALFISALLFIGHNLWGMRKVGLRLFNDNFGQVLRNYPFIKIEQQIYARIDNKELSYGVYEYQDMLNLRCLLNCVPNKDAWNYFLKNKLKTEKIAFDHAQQQCIHPDYLETYNTYVHQLFEKFMGQTATSEQLQKVFLNNHELNKKRWVISGKLEEFNHAERSYFVTRNMLQLADLYINGHDVRSKR